MKLAVLALVALLSFIPYAWGDDEDTYEDACYTPSGVCSADTYQNARRSQQQANEDYPGAYTRQRPKHR